LDIKKFVEANKDRLKFREVYFDDREQGEEGARFAVNSDTYYKLCWKKPAGTTSFQEVEITTGMILKMGEGSLSKEYLLVGDVNSSLGENDDQCVDIECIVAIAHIADIFCGGSDNG
jgi:hypothetical protein